MLFSLWWSTVLDMCETADYNDEGLALIVMLILLVVTSVWRPVGPARPVLFVMLAGLDYDACHMGDTLW